MRVPVASLCDTRFLFLAYLVPHISLAHSSLSHCSYASTRCVSKAMATRAQPLALAQTTALAYACGGPVSLVEGPPDVHPRTASHLPGDTTRGHSFQMTTGVMPVALHPPAYESRGSMHTAGAVAAASAQQGLDNLYLLEMLEDDALDALAGELKSLAADWVRGGVAWWKAGRSENSSQRGKEGRQGSATSQKKPSSTSARWARSTKPAEVKRKEEEQRNRARDGRTRPLPEPIACNSCHTAQPASQGPDPQTSLSPAWLMYPPSADLAKPLPALPPCAERPTHARPCCTNDPIRSFGSGRRHSETSSLRRRRTGSSGEDGDPVAGDL